MLTFWLATGVPAVAQWEWWCLWMQNRSLALCSGLTDLVLPQLQFRVNGRLGLISVLGGPCAVGRPKN